MSVATAAPPAPAAAGGGKQPVVQRKFRAATQEHQEAVVTVNITPAAAATTFVQDIPAYGFLRGLWIRLTVSGGSGGGTAAVYKQDAPFSWIQQLIFQDVNSAPIVFAITGYDLYLIYKYGGYFISADPKQSEEYTQGGTGGNSVFMVYLPLEIRLRDGLGALPNTSANTAYKLFFTGGSTTDVFSTLPAPTVPTNLKVQVFQESYWEPAANDFAGRPQEQDPPSKDTTQYWSKTSFTHVASEAITDQIKRLGYLYRNWIGTCRDTGPLRSTTNFPDPLICIYEGQQLTIRDKTLWRHQMARWFGYTAAVDVAGGLDTGVFILPFDRDFFLYPGCEIGSGYLPSTSGTRVEFQGTITAGGTLQWLINDVSAADELDITGGA